MRHKLNLGIVTVWDERGAGYVSKLYYTYLKDFFQIKIFARGYSKNKFKKEDFVYEAKKVGSFKPMSIQKKEFKKWIDKNNIEILLFNEQQSWEPILWCKDWGIKTSAYIDYYTEDTIELHNAYDMVICNTKRHFEAFSQHHNSVYYKWGTDLTIFKPFNEKIQVPTFFHSCGYSPDRKGTDKVIEAFFEIEKDFKLIIHSQVDLDTKLAFLKNEIEFLKKKKKLEIINKTVEAPGLYHMADYYVYPTKLEGIGLTLIEAIACGLIPIIPDSQPMNEFVDNNSYKIEIDRLYSRNDGYYWPQVEINLESFLKIINKILEKHSSKPSKEKVAKFAHDKLNYRKNFDRIEEEFLKLEFRPLNEATKEKIINFENARPLNHKRILKVINNLYALYFKFLKWN